VFRKTIKENELRRGKRIYIAKGASPGKL